MTKDYSARYVSDVVSDAIKARDEKFAKLLIRSRAVESNLREEIADIKRKADNVFKDIEEELGEEIDAKLSLKKQLTAATNRIDYLTKKVELIQKERDNAVAKLSLLKALLDRSVIELSPWKMT